ncbi:hypothetical protein [Pseudomonas sp. 5P_5.1_Bac1]|uniref:hypothetical protein n=1 Tax=Pseudomonas sp. 5P_5.1_Bac1 TaxID=2971616 RepID=UPI0021C91E1A|nr:hypothetical protein [Pseudomonas sp. 5P_5.1_Bac1]MCU1722704.1 hypothetical protein [Pseudomonas sp. 5P_5.1_Bac1]
MAKPSLTQLKSWLASGPRGLGWEMIVAYDRDMINELLQQQYIHRFSQSDFIPAISQSIDLTHSTEHMQGIRLRAPVASFEGDSLRLSMDCISGTIITEVTITGAVPYIGTVRNLLPVGGPQLTLGVPLTELTGQVGDGRRIVLDISKGTEFLANFVLDTQSQQVIGQRFKHVFQSLPESQRTYDLGQLADDFPVPKKVVMRVMPVPGTRDSASSTLGGGALLMFVRFEKNADGSFPGPDFLYPIPEHTASKRYTISTLTFWDSAKKFPGDTGAGELPEVMSSIGFGDHYQVLVNDISFSGQPGAHQGWYGDLQLSSSVYDVTPAFPVIWAGAYFGFSTVPPVSNGVLSWSARGTDPANSNVGSISTLGNYVPPEPASMKSDCENVTVSASWKVAGRDLRSCALVSILKHPLAVSPTFEVCSAGKSVSMTAAIPSSHASTLSWRIVSPGMGGTLGTATNRLSCTYQAAAPGTQKQAIYLERVRVKSTYSHAPEDEQDITILVLNVTPSVPMCISAQSQPETNRVQLQVLRKGVPVNLNEVGDYVLERMLMPATCNVTEDGIFSAASTASGIAILHLTVLDDFSDHHGFIVLPMPLWAHEDVMQRTNRSIMQHAMARSPH